MQIKTIEDALDDRDMPRIREAFHALALWPHGEPIEGAEGPGDLAGLIDRVTAALESDLAPLPEDVANRLSEVAPLAAPNHAAGARLMAGHFAVWSRILSG